VRWDPKNTKERSRADLGGSQKNHPRKEVFIVVVRGRQGVEGEGCEIFADGRPNTGGSLEKTESEKKLVSRRSKTVTKKERKSRYRNTKIVLG